MKFTTTIVKTAIGAAGVAAASVVAAATAVAAPPNIQGFGTSEPLIDGPLVTTYTVSNLQPSNVAIPGYTPKGTLYQADITARSDGGLVTPMVNDFIARGPNGQNYRVIDKVQAPGSLNPAPIPQGNESTGTLYFDVTGAPPNGVVYNDGMQDILMWTSNVPGNAGQGTPPNAVPAPGQLPGTPPNSGPAPGGVPGPTT
ncbi:MAG TPA: MPT63 family protein [Mycobacterium sp.]